jgi:hypothetical protein
VLIDTTTMWIGYGAVYHGPAAAVAHGLTGVQLIWCCGSHSLAVRNSGARGRYDEPIPWVFGEQVALGREGR